MRKIPVFFLLLLLVVFCSSCKKSGAPELTELNATVYKAAPASDGPPRDELYLDSLKEFVVPINKIGAWPQNDLAPVAVRFVDTGKTYAVATMSGTVIQLRVVYLVTFRAL
jgi:hypothetical protein